MEKEKLSLFLLIGQVVHTICVKSSGDYVMGFQQMGGWENDSDAEVSLIR